LTGVNVSGDPATGIETYLYLEKFSACVPAALQKGQVLSCESVMELAVRGHAPSLHLGRTDRKGLVSA
jgi:hypothetical protein